MKSIPQQLLALQTKLVSKLGKQPYFSIEMSIEPQDSQAFKVHYYGQDINDWNYVRGDTAQEVLDLMQQHISNLPTPEEAERWQFISSLAKVIDEAPAEVDTTPLINLKSEYAGKLLGVSQ